MAKVHPITNSLKITHYKGIGRIIFSGALFEYAVAATLINALGLHRKEGRATIIPQTMKTNLELLMVISKNRGMSPKELKNLKKMIAEISDQAQNPRNVVAHGVWQPEASSGEIGVTSFRGGTDRKRAFIGDRFLVKENTLSLMDEAIRSWHWVFIEWVNKNAALLFQSQGKPRAPFPLEIPSPAGTPPKQPLRLQLIPRGD